MSDIYKGIRYHKELLKDEYGTGKIDAHGEPEVDWSKLSKYADKDGFDIRALIDGIHYKIKGVLPKGTIIIRYGSEMGRFTAPNNTPYEKLALPYKKETVEFHRYIVIGDDVKIKCIVDKGIVAPGFGSDGGAVQYLHEKTVYYLLKNNFIKRME